MQKNSTQKALSLFTLLFVLLAVASFAAFRETEPIYTGAQSCLKASAPAQSSEMLWEVVFRQFLSLISI
jgi:hypothetical protein